MEENASLRLANENFEFPIIEGSEGEKAVDLQTLRQKSGYITYDDGYGNTGSCKSSITFIDGEKGILRYRGYSIEDVCGHLDFPETAYMVIYGELPTQEQYNAFMGKIHAAMKVDEGVINLLKSFGKDAAFF